MTTDTDGTGLGLAEFFAYAASKGLMNKSTAGARKTAAVKVLSIDDDWETRDLRELDLDEQISRFQTLNKGSYQPNSLATYASRFRSAVEEYLKYLDDPAAYKPAAANRKPRQIKRTVTDNTEATDAATANVWRTAPAQEPAVAPPPRSSLVTYPFPLRPGVMAYAQLPPDFRPHEAERMARFLASVAMEPPPDEED